MHERTSAKRCHRYNKSFKEIRSLLCEQFNEEYALADSAINGIFHQQRTKNHCHSSENDNMENTNEANGWLTFHRFDWMINISVDNKSFPSLTWNWIDMEYRYISIKYCWWTTTPTYWHRNKRFPCAIVYRSDDVYFSGDTWVFRLVCE